MTLDRLLSGLGADVAPWSLKTRCCGGSLMGTVKAVGANLSNILLAEARKTGADMIVTVCPLCQFNLEVAQLERGSPRGKIPVLFFTQIVGIALGIDRRRLGLARQMIPPDPALTAFGGKEVSRVQ